MPTSARHPLDAGPQLPDRAVRGLIRTYAAYVSDEWKVTPRLTLTAGMRYQYYAVPKDANGRMALFDPQTASIVVPTASLSLVSPLLPSLTST